MAEGTAHQVTDTDDTKRTSLAKLMADRGWSLRQLALICGAKGCKVSAGHLAKIVRAVHRPRPALVAALADAFGVDRATFSDLTTKADPNAHPDVITNS